MRDVTQGATRSAVASDLERSRAPTASVTSPTYETDGPSVGGIPRRRRQKRVVPRIEDSHLLRHPTGHSSLLFPETLLPCPHGLLALSPRPLPPGRPARSLNLPGHLHPRYLASRRLLIRGFTESKTLNAHRSPVEVRQRSDQPPGPGKVQTRDRHRRSCRR